MFYLLRVNSSSSRLAISGGAAADPLTGGASPKVGGSGEWWDQSSKVWHPLGTELLLGAHC